MQNKIDDKVINSLLENYKKPDDLIGKDGILKQLTKQLVEKALDGEMTHHLGYEKHSTSGNNSGNSRNGNSSKTIKGDFGEMEVTIPRDRNAGFEPTLIKKNQTRFDGFDDKIISLYSNGMSTRDITLHLQDIYGVEVSAELISNVTSSIIEEVKEWQRRPLESIYPIVFLDGLVVKIRDQGHVINKHVYLALGLNTEGIKDVLGIWIEQNEGAKFWLKVITEIKNRGVEDILIACVDGLKGFPEAIESVYGRSQVQLCIVHMVRNSLRFVSWQDRKAVAKELKSVYSSISEGDAKNQLESFSKNWDKKYPTISKSWRTNWERIIPFFSYPNEIRRMIYTTNAIESLNYTIRKTIKTKGSFPNDESATKMIYLSLQKMIKKWTKPQNHWSLAINQFSIMFEGRIKI